MRFIVLLSSLAFCVAAQTGPQFSPANMDTTADPCADFYQYACGNWMAKNPIPPDQSAWSVASQLVERNREVLRTILEKASVNSPNRKRTN